jgi:outer membrane protein TolC
MLLGLTIMSAPALSSAAEPPVLNLQQLTIMALKYSPQVKAKQQDIDLAKAQKDQAHAYRFPQLDMVAVGGLVPNARAPFMDNTGHLLYPDPANRIHGVNVFGHLDFTVIQPIYTFGKIAYPERAAERNIKIQEAGVDAEKGTVMLQVSQAYYGLILANQGKGAVQDARTYLSDARTRINRLLAVHSTSVKETDVYRLAMYEGGVEKFAAQADQGAKVAYQALKALIGYGPDQDFRVPIDLPTPAPARQPLNYYIEESLELRPEYTQLKEGLVARELLVKAAKADQFPNIFAAVFGQVAQAAGRAPVAGVRENPAIPDWFNAVGGLPVLGVQYHFDFGITRAKIRQAQAELAKLKEEQKTALMGIPVQVGKAYGQVQENYKASVGLEKAYVNARRWLITAFSNFDMGLGTMDDIFRAFERYGAFRGDYLKSLYDYNFATAELSKATGAYRRTTPEEKVAAKPAPGAAAAPTATPAPAVPIKPVSGKGK